MADAAVKKNEPDTKAPAAGPSLAPAAESGSPDVQRLLAERQAHLQNILPEDPEVAARREAAKKSVEDIDRQLAELGYAA